MDIRRTILTTVGVAISCGTCLLAQSANPPVPSSVTNADVISLHAAGFSEDFIIAKINASNTVFTVQVSDLVELKKAGISERVITTMLEKSSAPRPPTVAVPVSVAPSESRAIAPVASDQCPAIAASLAKMPGATLADKIRAYKPSSYREMTDERLERLYLVEFPCISEINTGAKPEVSQIPQAQALVTPTKGCLAVKDVGSNALRNIMLGGVAGALISKKQYQVVDAVNYPAKIGQKFHGSDLQTLQSGGTRIVILAKQYTSEDLHKACE